MDIVLVILLTSLLTALLVGGFVVYYFQVKIKPYLDNKVDEFREISEQMEENIKKGVKTGVHESFKEIPGATVKETTRSVVKIGSGLVEGGISSIFKDK